MSRPIKRTTEIEKVIECRCGKGTMKLKSILIDPKDGKVALSYSACSEPFCHHGRAEGREIGFLVFTNIIIAKLVFGE